MKQEEIIKGLSETGRIIRDLLNISDSEESHEFIKTLRQAQHRNPWFTTSNQRYALKAIAGQLEKKSLEGWLENYPELLQENKNPKTIGLVMAGNIPLVGFHDLLCVLSSGNNAMIKCSSDDTLLVQYMVQLIFRAEPAFSAKVTFVNRLSGMDAVIATGSDNTARYFDFYFSRYPHIIRKNRNAVAILTGSESAGDLIRLGDDIFIYFGMGCRNVSKLMVPEGYSFNDFFKAMESHKDIMQHNRYCSNFDYYQAVLMLKKVPFLTNNFLIIKEDKAIATPVSILNYSFYLNPEALKKSLEEDSEKIQCLVSASGSFPGSIPFGSAQQPGLMDYADGVDTMKFLVSLR